jgi:cobalt-zinc-cadmium resistance protein CzcA
MDMAKKARLVLAGFPEVRKSSVRSARPDDGSDASGFYNNEFFGDLRPREQCAISDKRCAMPCALEV